MVTLDEQVSCLFESHLKFFHLELLYTFQDYEQSVVDGEVSLQLKVKGNLILIWAYSCLVYHNSRVSLLTVKGAFILNAFLLVKRDHVHFGFAIPWMIIFAKQI